MSDETTEAVCVWMLTAVFWQIVILILVCVLDNPATLNWQGFMLGSFAWQCLNGVVMAVAADMREFNSAT